MLVVVIKNKHTHDCTSQKQLDRFLAAGWTKAKKQPKPDTPKEAVPEQEKGPEQGEE